MEVIADRWNYLSMIFHTWLALLGAGGFHKQPAKIWLMLK
jgi:hypothetical protein